MAISLRTPDVCPHLYQMQNPLGQRDFANRTAQSQSIIDLFRSATETIGLRSPIR